MFLKIRILALGILLASVFLCSCRQDNSVCYSDNTEIRILRLSDTLNILQHIVNDSVISDWQLNYCAQNLSLAYLNSDSVPEVLVLVTKKTRFWRKFENRLFVFKLYNGRLIRPLWLGSKIGGELLDYSVRRDTFPNRIITDCILDSCRRQLEFSLGEFGPKFERVVN